MKERGLHFDWTRILPWYWTTSGTVTVSYRFQLFASSHKYRSCFIIVSSMPVFHSIDVAGIVGGLMHIFIWVTWPNLPVDGEWEFRVISLVIEFSEVFTCDSWNHKMDSSISLWTSPNGLELFESELIRQCWECYDLSSKTMWLFVTIVQWETARHSTAS